LRVATATDIELVFLRVPPVNNAERDRVTTELVAVTDPSTGLKYFPLQQARAKKKNR
jgi:hypothetical protein